MANVKLGIVAPYEELGYLCEEVCLELSERAEIKVGNLTEGIKLAGRLERSGIDAIITRGGTALLIERAVQIPVIRIEVSTVDIIRALIKARGFGQTIAVIGFRNVIYGIEEIAELLEIEVIPIEIESETEIESKLKSAVKEGIEVVVGDVISTKTTSKFGLHSVLICSGKQAIKEAILNAKNIAMVRMSERQRAQELSTILEFAYEGIIGVDLNGRIRVFNPVSERVLGIKKENALGLPVETVIPGLSLEKISKLEKIKVGELKKIGQTTIVITCVPIRINDKITGAVITFQDVTRIQQLEEKVRRELHSKGHVAKYSFEDIKTVDATMKKLIHQARKYSKVDSAVLIIGETGTGKELFAQSIHNASNRREFPFVAINCAAMPESLLESELFGYEEGAFTGARKGGKKGVFEQAHRGTIFLDEIGEMPVELQSRLLRVIEEQEIMRIGANSIIPVDVRIVAATNVNLKDAIKEGSFREDLYYRLGALMIQVPPLRNRPEDIIMFAKEFLIKFTQELGQLPKQFEPEAFVVLQSYPWPGNVRELNNIIQRIVVGIESNVVNANKVAEILNQDDFGRHPNSPREYGGTLADLEQGAIERALEATGGNRKRAAEILGISRTTLWRKLNPEKG